MAYVTDPNIFFVWLAKYDKLYIKKIAKNQEILNLGTTCLYLTLFSVNLKIHKVYSFFLDSAVLWLGNRELEDPHTTCGHMGTV